MGRIFFTVALCDRSSALLVEHIELLRDSVRPVRKARPFKIDAWVVLPRCQEIKARFSRALPRTEKLTGRQFRNGERDIWQRRFWERTIGDDADFAPHVDYVHLNPYKHGLVRHVRECPYSTFHRYVAEGIYPIDWMTDPVDMKAGE